VTRDLLRAYVRLLNGLDIPRAVIRWWMLWFTTPETSVYIDESSLPTGTAAGVCTHAARSGKAGFVISLRGQSHAGDGESETALDLQWLSPSDFLNSQQDFRS
jgi:hypothetical protein